MRARNVPTIDPGYWAAIVAASMCGTNTGDLAAGPLGMGHVRGVLPLAAFLLAVIWAEKVLDWATVAFYWLAIIIMRTMATNIADFATHDAKLSYPVFLLLLIAFMAVMLWAERFWSRQREQPVDVKARLPVTDWNYWVVMLAAGVLGTALGDWLAQELKLGVYWASLIGLPFFVVALWAAYRFGLSKPWYWIAIAVCRTWGTNLGDMLVVMFRSISSRQAALWMSTVITAVLLTGIICFWTHRNSVTTAAAPGTSC
jgi:uncharacterized membrane-anchored protein